MPRVALSTMMLLVVLQGSAVMLICGWYFQISPCGSSPSEGKVHVLLLSSWRSGSSFLGQVFSQHPSVFYLMEPGWHVWTTLHRVSMSVLRVALRDQLWGLFKCDVSSLEAYLPEQHNVSSVFMWSHSRALCSPPACSLTQVNEISNPKDCAKACNVRGLQGLKEACSVHSHVVLKEVRFFELESLYPLLQDPTIDLRIVHLIRDPRAVALSREEAVKSLSYDSSIILGHKQMNEIEASYEAMLEICRSHIRINELAMSKPPPFLKDRYKMVRYEDMVRDPIGQINSIYDFVGLEMTKEMGEWIYRVTHGKGRGKKSEAFSITSRDASDVSQAWRSLLPHNKVQKIQDMCKGAMSMLGYRTVNSEKEQADLDIDLLVPEKPYEFTWVTSKTKL
ncbi:uncharacterized protein V6R79_007983 [Siganus canaliculatus]